MRIAVAGGTGVVGRHVVEVAQEAGHDAVVLSRRAGVDLLDEAAVGAGLEGAQVVIDVANPGTTDARGASRFFTEVTARLQRQGEAAGIRHLVVLSIVGIDQLTGYGYYRAKLDQEEEARRGPVPATIVRATQFHEFAGQMLARGRRGPVALVPALRVQPVAARSVAEALVEIAAQAPGAGLVEIAGPERLDLVTMARAVARRERPHLAVVPLRVPGPTGRAMRRGGQLPGPGARILGPRFGEWLSGRERP